MESQRSNELEASIRSTGSGKKSKKKRPAGAVPMFGGGGGLFGEDEEEDEEPAPVEKKKTKAKKVISLNTILYVQFPFSYHNCLEVGLGYLSD